MLIYVWNENKKKTCKWTTTNVFVLEKEKKNNLKTHVWIFIHMFRIQQYDMYDCLYIARGWKQNKKKSCEWTAKVTILCVVKNWNFGTDHWSGVMFFCKFCLISSLFIYEHCLNPNQTLRTWI